MAIIEQEELTTNIEVKDSPYARQSQQLLERDSNLQSQVDVENSSIEDKLTATSLTWENTYLATTIDWFKNSAPYLLDNDDEFMKNMTNERFEMIMRDNNLPPKYYDRLSDAKNQEHLAKLINETVDDLDKERFVSKTLNSYNPTLGIFSEASSAGLATGLLGDVDTLTIPIGIGLSSKLGKIATASMATTVHVTASAIAYEKDPDVSGTEAIVFGSLGVLADTFAISRLGHKADVLTDEVSVKLEKEGMADNTVDEIIQHVNERNINIVDRGDPLTGDKLRASRLFDIADEVKKDGTPTTRASKALNELEEMGYDIGTSKKLTDELEVLKKDKTRKEAFEQKSAEIKALRTKVVDNILKSKQARKASTFKGVSNIKDSATVKQLSWETRYMKKEAEEMLHDLNLFKRYVRDIFSEVKNNPTNLNAKTTLDKINTNTQALFDNGLINKSEFDQITHAIKHGKPEKLDKFNVTFKKNADGTFSPVSKDKKRTSKLVIAGGMLLAADALMADDGMTITVAGIGGAVILGGLMMLAGGNAKGIFNATRDAAVGSVKKMRNQKHIEFVEETVASARVSFMESFTPLVKDPSKEFSNMAQDLLWDAFDGTKHTAEAIKRDLYGTQFKVLEGNLNEAYKMWMEENKQGVLGRLTSQITLGLTERQRFDIDLTNAIETGVVGESKALRKAVDDVNVVKDTMLREMKEAGVEGAEEIIPDINYMPRKVRSGSFGTLLRELRNKAEDGAGKEYDKVVNAIANMMDGENKTKRARVYLDMIADMGTSKQTFETMENMDEYLKSKGITDVTAKEVADLFGITSSVNKSVGAAEQFGRTKRRIELDMTKFETFKVQTMDGDVDVSLDTIFVRQATELMNGYINQASGYVALARKGYTVPNAYGIAEKSATQSLEMKKVLDSILGIPLFDGSSTTSKLMRDAENYTTAISMSFSALTLAGEALKLSTALNKTGLNTAVKQLVRTILKQGDTELVRSLREGTGMAIHKKGLTFGSFNSITAENLMDGSYRSSKFGRGATKLGEWSRDMILYPMVATSDWLSAIALSKNGQLFLDISTGTKKITDDRLKAFGIGESEMALARKYLSKNRNGELKPVAWDNMSPEELRTMQRVFFNMNQKDIMLTTMGGSPSWSRNNEVGVLTSHLMKFPMNAYANHGLFDAQGMAKGDMRSFVNMSAWFIGGMITQAMKSEVKGKPLSNEDMVLRALWSMPIFGFGNVADGLTSPAIFGASENVAVGSKLIYGN